MTIQIAVPNCLPVPIVAAHIGEAVYTGRTISDDVAASIASWYSEFDPVMERLANGKPVERVEFMWAMFGLALDGRLNEAEVICLDHLDEWATLRQGDGGKA